MSLNREITRKLSIKTLQSTQPSKRMKEKVIFRSMDGPRDLSHWVKPVREGKQRMTYRENLQIPQVNQFINWDRLTDIETRVYDFFLRLGKGNNKRLGLTETHYLLSERQLKWTYWIAQGSLLNTLKEPIWEKTPKKRRIDVPLCITESSSCQPKTNTAEINSTSLENKS